MRKSARRLMMGETETAFSYVCLLPIVGGVALASMGDMSFSALAFAVVQVSNLGFSGRAVFVKQLKSGHKTWSRRGGRGRAALQVEQERAAARQKGRLRMHMQMHSLT